MSVQLDKPLTLAYNLTVVKTPNFTVVQRGQTSVAANYNVRPKAMTWTSLYQGLLWSNMRFSLDT